MLNLEYSIESTVYCVPKAAGYQRYTNWLHPSAQLHEKNRQVMFFENIAEKGKGGWCVFFSGHAC